MVSSKKYVLLGSFVVIGWLFGMNQDNQKQLLNEPSENNVMKDIDAPDVNNNELEDVDLVAEDNSSERDMFEQDEYDEAEKSQVEATQKNNNDLVERGSMIDDDNNVKNDIVYMDIPPVPQNTTVPVIKGDVSKNTSIPLADELNLKFKKNEKLNNNEELSMKQDTVNIGMEKVQLVTVANNLQSLLANEFVLYVKTLNFHWNIEGKHFGPLHTFFNNHYDKLSETIDAIAERIRALGNMTRASMKEFLKDATLKESENNFPDDVTMLRLLLADHEEIIRQLRNISDIATKANDHGTANFVGGLLEVHEKFAWMIRAHIQ